MNKWTDKEKWVNDVMDSTKGMQKADPGPFLYGKIRYRLQQGEPGTERISKVTLQKWAVAVILLILVNCVSVIKEFNKEQQQHTPPGKHLLSEFDTETTYNY